MERLGHSAFEATLSLKVNNSLEARVFHLLNESGIDFCFNYKIGPYVVTFLVGDKILMLKGDERRRQYFAKMGYDTIFVTEKIIGQRLLDILQAPVRRQKVPR